MAAGRTRRSRWPFAATLVVAQTGTIVMASTTSTEQSGLFAHLLPEFKKATGIDVKVVAVGTGQAIDMAAAATPTCCSCTTRSPKRKSWPKVLRSSATRSCTTTSCWSAPGRPGQCQRQGHRRRPEKAQPANANFVSRGDKSGTHAAELRYWKSAGGPGRQAGGSGYKECGCGMGPALNIAASSGNATCWPTAAPGCQLQEPRRPGGAGRRRHAAVQPVRRDGGEPAKFPHVKAAEAQKFVDWVISPAGQTVIAGYKIGGEQLFFPNATK
jgi:tungstate transport system substrate-binding protein